MAIRTDYYYGEELIPNAYLRIKKMSLAVGETEKFREDEDGVTHAYYETEPENMAYVFVYADQDARDKAVRPINQFAILFNWTEGENPWHNAYSALKQTKNVVENGYEDVLEEGQDED